MDVSVLPTTKEIDMYPIRLLIHDKLIRFDEILTIEIDQDVISIETDDGEIHDFCFEKNVAQIYRKIMLIRAFLNPEHL